MVSVNMRIKTIRGYSNYLGMKVDAEEIQDAVIVTITSYRERRGRAYEYLEFWIVPNATLDNPDYLDMDAYPIQIPVASTMRKVYFRWSRRFRWR